MRFFRMEQDKRLPDVIQFRDFDICDPRHVFYREDAGTLNDYTMMYTAKQCGETAPDFIQSPVHMVSETVKDVLDMYEDDLIFPAIVITNQKKETMWKYYHLLLERRDLFSDLTEFYPSGTVKRLVLDQEKIGEYKVFMLKDNRFTYPFVSLEVLESLLRRKITGILFREVEVI